MIFLIVLGYVLLGYLVHIGGILLFGEEYFFFEMAFLDVLLWPFSLFAGILILINYLFSSMDEKIVSKKKKYKYDINGEIYEFDKPLPAIYKCAKIIE